MAGQLLPPTELAPQVPSKDVDLLIDIGGTPVGQVIDKLRSAGVTSKRPDPLIKLEDAQFDDQDMFRERSPR